MRDGVVNHFSALRETLLPYQTVSGVAWLIAGVCCAGDFSQAFSDSTFLWVVCCVICARFSGMCWNRLIDSRFDAKNPRTVSRALPSRKMKSYQMALYALLFLGIFLGACLFFPPSHRFLGLGVAVAIITYSFMKRLSSFCHFFLGALYAFLPIVGSILLVGSVTTASVFFAVAAFCAVSGGDILYAMQDEQFDRRFGLYSLPAKMGLERSLEIACALHAIAFASITHGLYYSQIGIAGYVVWFGGAAFILGQWRKIWTRGIEGVPEAFPSLLVGFPVAAVGGLVLDFI